MPCGRDSDGRVEGSGAVELWTLKKFAVWLVRSLPCTLVVVVVDIRRSSVL